MRTLAIGDIHGCLHALDLLLEVVGPRPDDLLVMLGDYVDRGPDSKGVLDRLVDLRSRCKLVSIKGNHDLMMMQARQSPDDFDEWLASGGRQTLQSYGADSNWSLFAEAIPAPHWQFLEACVPYHEIDTHFFVHANAYADMPLEDQPDHMRYWERLNQETMSPHESGKIMICGHSSQRSGLPLVLDHAVCLDTWVFGDGWLTCLDVKTGQYWQANQQGKRDMRTDWVEMDG